ncbi:hypothetical protein SLE2022_255740 [Rubroshorea leprosula]
MAKNTVTSTVIVPDVLSWSNYTEWSNYMRNYLLGQNLWDVVESSNVKGTTDWERKNAAALHALQISCAPEISTRIMGETLAKEAWEQLAKIHKMKNIWDLDGPQSSSQGLELRRFFEGIFPEKKEPIEGSQKKESIERNESIKFLKAIFKQEWNEVMGLLEGSQLPGKNPQFLGQGTSLLHLAVQRGDDETVQKLVNIMSEEEILLKDDTGRTALAYAAYFGATKMAKSLTETSKKLLTIPDKEGMIPVVRACFQRFKDTTLDLYFSTLECQVVEHGKDRSVLDGEHGSLLLHFCILNEMLVIALDLLHKYPRLAFTRFYYNNRVLTPILTLSAQPSLFRSGTRFSFLRKLIYSCISVAKEHKEAKWAPDSVTSTYQNVQNDIERQGIADMYERKLIHSCAYDILDFTAGELSKLNAKQVVDSRVVPAFFQSIQHGIIEFFEIQKTNPDVMFCPIDGKTKFAFTYAIECRLEKYFRQFNTVDQGRILAALTDEDGNNALHIVAKLGPESYLAQFSGAALQMQAELNWFKEIESTFPVCKSWVNNNGETPRQVFTREHMKLLKEAEAWMKKTANSYIIVGTLIITIMFAAAFSIPGGNNGNGYPMFSHKRLFLTYIMSDAISLFAASTSVLTFLGILTYPYTEKDFLWLSIGILTLLISVATMMVAFCAAVSIMLPDRWWVIFSLVLFAIIPVVVFCLSQSQILSEISIAIWGLGLFNRRRFFIIKKKDITYDKEIYEQTYEEKGVVN